MFAMFFCADGVTDGVTDRVTDGVTDRVTDGVTDGKQVQLLKLKYLYVSVLETSFGYCFLDSERGNRFFLQMW